MTDAIGRIVVPLDDASENRTAIDTAARLAARTGAPLHGVFVEDEELLHLASLPFSRQVAVDAGAEPLTSEAVELHLRAAAERARRQLFEAARRYRVTCTFDIVRGAAHAAVAGASQRDLVVAGALTRPVAGHFRVECRWLSAIGASAGPLLLARTIWNGSGSVVMLLRDRDPAAARLFAAAARLAAAKDSILTVIYPSALSGAAGLEQWVADRAAEHPARVQVETVPEDPTALRERLGQLDCRLLAFEAGSAGRDGGMLLKLVERFACDMLIVP